MKTSNAKVVIYFDYEMQAGADQAISTKGKWTGHDDYSQCEKLLKILAEYDFKVTFAVVGFCAEQGSLPYHAPAQIKKIADLGHEVASHSYKHEYFPELSEKEIEESLRKSKKVLEEVTKQEVVSFVPPHNQPAEFQGITVDVKKHKRISKISLRTLQKILKRLGYKTYRNYHWTPLQDKLFKIYKSYPVNSLEGVTQIQLNTPDGFATQAYKVVKHAIKHQKVATLCSHPWVLALKGPQGEESLRKFLSFLQREQQKGTLQVCRAKDLI